MSGRDVLVTPLKCVNPQVTNLLNMKTIKTFVEECRDQKKHCENKYSSKIQIPQNCS